MTTFADQAFCNTGSQFCNTCMFKRRNGTPKETRMSQNGKFCTRAIRQAPQRKILYTGDPTGAPAEDSVRGRLGGNVAKNGKPLTRYFAVALSKIKRKPSSVSCEFVSVMVLDALATRTARPPVATTGAV